MKNEVKQGYFPCKRIETIMKGFACKLDLNENLHNIKEKRIFVVKKPHRIGPN